jgi:chromosomal replication initiation ATPase DnaA
MKNQNQLAPSNNKSLFHSLANLFAQVANDEVPIEKAEALCNIAGKMQKSLEIEINRSRTNFIIGRIDSNIREIEITNPEA